MHDKKHDRYVPHETPFSECEEGVLLALCGPISFIVICLDAPQLENTY